MEDRTEQEILRRLAHDPGLKRFDVEADKILPGDVLVNYGPVRDVVRVYPFGQSGDAPFMEIGFGSVAVAIYRHERVTIYRNPDKERKLKRTHSEDGNRCIRIELVEGP